MLKKLHIQNYALIEHLEINPVPGLNIITGETGAGKSILLGAVGLLLGNRADTSVLFSEGNKCVIEGIFDIRDYRLEEFFEEQELDFEEDTIVRREINPAGKSRAFINDTPVTLDVMRTLGGRLMDIHSQHESLLLGKSNFQLNLIDSYAGSLDARAAYQEKFRELRRNEKLLEDLKQEKANLEKEADYQQFILDELTSFDLRSGEQEELESEVQVMEHAEEIRNNLTEAGHLLDEGETPVLASLRIIRSLLNSLSRYGRNYEELYERLDSSLIELDDISTEIQQASEEVDLDPEKASSLQERLSQIYQLQKKHHVQTIDELIAIRANLEKENLHYHDLDEKIQETRRQCESLREEAVSIAGTLSRKRTISAPALEVEMTTLLKKVGIPEASFKVRIQPGELNPDGHDQVQLLFSANKGVAEQNLVRVASGGEFSRLMFCIKRILAEKVSLPTVIFDEIDTGISGEIALKMGDMMKYMASKHQIIAISHLPQMAARADRHYYVYKESGKGASVSKIRELTEDERIQEIAKMIGGDTPSENARESAKELINHH